MEASESQGTAADEPVITGDHGMQPRSSLDHDTSDQVHASSAPDPSTQSGTPFPGAPVAPEPAEEAGETEEPAGEADAPPPPA